jgi:glutathione synthase/RimK-type ligase-like ATP-grasp enzyme
VRVIRRSRELHALADEPGPLFAQRYHAPDGLDRKIYCIGRQMFGVKRVWPARTHEAKVGEPIALSTELHIIAERCGRAFGVGLYGFDVVFSAGRPYVVDFSSFPDFTGVPEAALRLADYIYAYGQNLTHGERLVRRGQEVAR